MGIGDKRREQGRGPKRRKDQDQRFRSRTSSRVANRVILILTNGNTEELYFNQLKRIRYGAASTLKIDVEKHNQSRVSKLWQVAKQKQQDVGAELCFVVADRDFDKDYDSFIKRTSGLTGEKLHFIPSSPCFEYWLLLHYENTARAYVRQSGAGGCSAEVIADLNNHWPNGSYSKTCSPELYDRLITDKLKDAMIRARQNLANSGEAPFVEHPCSYVHKLIEAIDALVPKGPDQPHSP